MTDRRTFLCEDFEISYEDTKKGWSMPYSHHHTNYEIYILLSGERLVTIGDITYRVKAGMASLFESNISHRSVGDTDYTGICIHFSKVYLEKYLFTCRSIFLPDLFQGTDYFHSRGLQTKARRLERSFLLQISHCLPVACTDSYRSGSFSLSVSS